MKRIEDIKEFKDIDTYYEISEIVNEVFQDRVEAHKYLVTANKEIERLNLIIKAIKEQCDVMQDYEMNEYIRQLENEKADSKWLRRVAGVDK